MTEKEKDKFLDDLFSKETVREKMIRQLNDPYHNPFSEGSIASEEFDLAMQRGTDRYEFELTVAVQRSDSRTAQDKLDAFVTGSGSSSIRQIIFNNSTLGLSDTSARVMEMNNYAADVSLNGIDAVGANLTIEVFTKGSS